MASGFISYLHATNIGQGLRLFRELSGVMDSGRACYFCGGILLKGIFLCDGKGTVMHAEPVRGYRKLRLVEFR